MVVIILAFVRLEICILAGDTNPIHTTGSLDQGAVVHGALLMGYVAGTIGANCPGAIVASQQVRTHIKAGLSFRTFSGNSGNLFFRKVEFSMISRVLKRYVLEFLIKNDKLLEFLSIFEEFHQFISCF